MRVSLELTAGWWLKLKRFEWTGCPGWWSVLELHKKRALTKVSSMKAFRVFREIDEEIFFSPIRNNASQI